MEYEFQRVCSPSEIETARAEIVSQFEEAEGTLGKSRTPIRWIEKIDNGQATIIGIRAFLG